MIDAGISRLPQAQPLLDFHAQYAALSGIVVGLESTDDPRQWLPLVQSIGRDQAVLSLDLKAGRPLTAAQALCDMPPLEIAQHAWLAGFRRLIVLDLQSVGGRQGPSTVALCSALGQQSRWQELISGGGVRSTGDLQTLADAGCHGALVATALHQMSLDRRELDALRLAGESS